MNRAEQEILTGVWSLQDFWSVFKEAKVSGLKCRHSSTNKMMVLVHPFDLFFLISFICVNYHCSSYSFHQHSVSTDNQGV